MPTKDRIYEKIFISDSINLMFNLNFASTDR